MAEGGVPLGGRNPLTRCGGRTEARGRQTERLKDLPRDPSRQRLAGQYLQRLAQQNEAGIGVDGALAGRGLERKRKAGLHQRLGRRGRAEELDITGQAGVVGQQMAKGHAPCRITGGAAREKAGQQFGKRCLQIEPALLMEQHRRGGGGRHLGEAGNIVDRRRRDRGRGLVVGKAAARPLKHNRATGEEAEGTAGKGARGDCLVQQTTGGGKAGLLRRIHRSIASYRSGGADRHPLFLSGLPVCDRAQP